MFLPDALDRAQSDPGRGGDSAPGPVRDLAGRLRAGESQHRTDGSGGLTRFAGWASLLVQQAVEVLLGEALLPALNGGSADAGQVGDLKDGQALGRKQDDASAVDVLEGASTIIADRAQPCLLGLGGDHADGLSYA